MKPDTSRWRDQEQYEVRLKVDVPEQPEEPLPPFNWVLWFAMVLLICSVLALRFAGFL